MRIFIDFTFHLISVTYAEQIGHHAARVLDWHCHGQTYLFRCQLRSRSRLSGRHDACRPRRLEKATFPDGRRRPHVIHLNYYLAEVDEVYFPQLQVVGDNADSVCALAGKL